MFGSGHATGDNFNDAQQTRFTGDEREKQHIRANANANTDHLGQMLRGTYEQPERLHRRHNERGDESVSQLSFGRRKWCQVDSEKDREQSVLQKSAMNSLGGHLATFSSPRVSETLNHGHVKMDPRSRTPRNRDKGYGMRNPHGNKWSRNDVEPNVNQRVGRNINEVISHGGLATSIQHSEYEPSSFLEAAAQSKEVGKHISGVMSFSRKDIIDYNNATVADSRNKMLTEYNAKANDSKRTEMNKTISSHGVRGSLENHSPRQDMAYLQRTQKFNKMPRSITAAGEGRWNIAPKIGASMQRAEKIGVKSPRIADKPYLNGGVPMESLQRPLGERGAPPIDTITGKVTRRAFDMTDLSNAQVKSVAKGMAGSGQKVSTLCGPQQSLREIMIEGNGNPVTGAFPQHYKQYSFRDVELAAKEGARLSDLADRQSRHLQSAFSISHA